MSPDEIRAVVLETVREAVPQAIEETLTRFGADVSDPIELQADFAFLRKQRQGVDDVSKWVKRSAVGVVVSGVVYAAYSGAVEIVRAKLGGG